MCGNCKKTGYCSQLHQRCDWKTHKKYCPTADDGKTAPASEILLPEFEIVIEQEELELNQLKKESEKEADARRLEEYEKLVKSGQAGTMTDTADLNENLAETKEDKTFGKFKKVIEPYELQVIRYVRHSSPLWISDNCIPNAFQVPKCELCKAKRSFEFQIMPQMLNELKNFELDWGVITIYTCTKDCDTAGQYAREFCLKQDLQDDEVEHNVNLEKMKIDDESEDEKVEAAQPKAKEAPKKPKNAKKKTPQPPKAQPAFANNDEWE